MKGDEGGQISHRLTTRQEGAILREMVSLCLVLISTSLMLATPLIFMNSPEIRVSAKFQLDQFSLSMLLPIIHPTAPVDLFLPKESGKVLKGLIAVESNFFVHALSEANAAGLTQLMEQTARELGVMNRFSVFQSIGGAKSYLNQLQKKFGSLELALAAYHEGPTKVARQGASAMGMHYAQKVLRQASRLEKETVFLKDAMYFEPYVSIGKNLSAGLNAYLSLLGTAYLVCGFNVSDQFSQHVYLYPAVSDSLCLIVGEKDFKFMGGFLYRKMGSIGVQFLFGKQGFSMDTIARVWKFYVTAGFSESGLRVGFVFK